MHVDDRSDQLSLALDSLYGAAMDGQDIAVFFRAVSAWLDADRVMWAPQRARLATNESTESWLAPVTKVPTQSYLSPLESDHVCEAPIARTDGSSLGKLVAFRNGVQARFSSVEFRRLNMIAEHVGHAFELKSAIRNAETIEKIVFAGFERLEAAVVVLAAEGRIVYSNASFQDLARASDSFTEVDGYLLFSQDSAQSWFLEALNSIRPFESATSANLTVGSGKGALDARLIPLSNTATGNADLALPGPLALLLVGPRASAPSPQTLAVAFSLTAAESVVASKLCEASRPKEIADATSTSLNTVRSHIKAIYRKAGVSSQIEFLGAAFATPLRHIRVREKKVLHPQRRQRKRKIS